MVVSNKRRRGAATAAAAARSNRQTPTTGLNNIDHIHHDSDFLTSLLETNSYGSESDDDGDSDISLNSGSESDSESDDEAHTKRGDYDIINDIKDMEDILFLQGGVMDIRNNRWDHGRLDWDAHVAQLEHEDKFVNEYTMSVKAHGNLVRILDPILERKQYNSRCSEPIQVEHITAIGLRCLAGGRPKDMRHIMGTSTSAAYDALDDFIDAVN
jgi:hypothetical protein